MSRKKMFWVMIGMIVGISLTLVVLTFDKSQDINLGDSEYLMWEEGPYDETNE